MIATEQNMPRQLKRLAAQRQIYGRAKAVFAVQATIGGPVAIFITLLVAAYPSVKGFGALFGISAALADVIWLTPWQRRLRDLAARIQEEFDCDVLDLPWNDVKAARPDPETVKRYSDRYTKRSRTPLRNWYAHCVDEIPIHMGRVACQRSNCWWDSHQRRVYAVSVLGLLLATALVALGLAMAGGITVEEFVLKVAAPLAPAVLLAVRQFTEQRESAERLDNLKTHAESLWRQCLNGLAPEEGRLRSRALQDELLDSRRKSPLIFDWIFRLLRPTFEGQMKVGVQQLVSEARRQAVK